MAQGVLVYVCTHIHTHTHTHTHTHAHTHTHVQDVIEGKYAPLGLRVLVYNGDTEFFHYLKKNVVLR